MSEKGWKGGLSHVGGHHVVDLARKFTQLHGAPVVCNMLAQYSMYIRISDVLIIAYVMSL